MPTCVFVVSPVAWWPRLWLHRTRAKAHNNNSRHCLHYWPRVRHSAWINNCPSLQGPLSLLNILLYLALMFHHCQESLFNAKHFPLKKTPVGSLLARAFSVFSRGPFASPTESSPPLRSHGRGLSSVPAPLSFHSLPLPSFHSCLLARARVWPRLYYALSLSLFNGAGPFEIPEEISSLTYAILATRERRLRSRRSHRHCRRRRQRNAASACQVATHKKNFEEKKENSLRSKGSKWRRSEWYDGLAIILSSF